MERLNPSIKICVIGSDHGIRGFENIPLIKQEAQNRFIPRNETGITAGNNLFLQEMFDGTEAMTRAYKGLGVGQSVLEAHLKATLPFSQEDIARRIAAIRLTPIEQRSYLGSVLLMVDDLRKSIDLTVDCEHYSNQQSVEYRRVADSTHRLIELATDSLIRGRFKDMNRLYAESLLKEAKHFGSRNRAVSKIVKEDVEELSSNHLPTVAIILIGYGHVKGLTREIRDCFIKAGQMPVVEGLYVGPYRSHRYDLVDKLVANPNYRLDQRSVTVALLHNALDFLSLFSEIDRDTWYDLLKEADRVNIDKLLRKIVMYGLTEGISQFIKLGR